MSSRYFHWSSVFDCVMHETDETGATTVTYTHEPVPYGPLLSENRSGTESYHHYDALGSTTMLTDDTGIVTDTFQYDAWGNDVARTGTTETSCRWCGRWGYQYDESTGSYYVRARIYQPTVARWMSVDPLSMELWSTLIVSYLYGSNSPTQLIDPTGWEAMTTDVYGAMSIVALMAAFAPPQPPPVVPQGMARGYLNSVSNLEDGQVGFKLKWTFAVQVANIPNAAHQLWQLNTIGWIEIDGRSCKLESHIGFLKDVGPLPNLVNKTVLTDPDEQGIEPLGGNYCLYIEARSVLVGFNQRGKNLPQGYSVAPDPRELPFLQNPAGPTFAFTLVYTYINTRVCAKCLGCEDKDVNDDYIRECISSPWGTYCKNQVFVIP